MTKSTLGRVSIERFLEVHGWRRGDSFACPYFTSPDGEWCVEIDEEWASPVKVHDPDVIGRECYNLAELERELVSLGAMEWECPNCGESGGKPITETSREWQGDAAHGGYVNWEETRCTNCVRTSGPQFDTCEERDGEA